MKTRKGRTFDPLPYLKQRLFAMYTLERRNREQLLPRSLRTYSIALAIIAIFLVISRMTANGFEFRSQISILGFPLLHIGREATGVIAIGGTAHGFIAIGGLAVGVVTIGGLSIGLFSLGGGALGLVASFGGLAIGYYCLGGAALGAHAFGDATAGYFTSCGITREVLLSINPNITKSDDAKDIDG